MNLFSASLPFDGPFDGLMVVSKVEPLMVVSEVEPRLSGE